MSESSWWNSSWNELATQLSSGILNEMKKRILTSNVKKEKLQLDDKSEKMKEFFEREIQRYNKRKKTLSEHRLQSQQAITDNERNKNQILELEKIIRKKEKDITDLREIIEKQMVMLRRLSKQRGIKIQ
jgi:hypothetical protein